MAEETDATKKENGKILSKENRYNKVTNKIFLIITATEMMIIIPFGVRRLKNRDPSLITINMIK